MYFSTKCVWSIISSPRLPRCCFPTSEFVFHIAMCLSSEPEGFIKANFLFSFLSSLAWARSTVTTVRELPELEPRRFLPSFLKRGLFYFYIRKGKNIQNSLMLPLLRQPSLNLFGFLKSRFTGSIRSCCILPSASLHARKLTTCVHLQTQHVPGTQL